MQSHPCKMTPNSTSVKRNIDDFALRVRPIRAWIRILCDRRCRNQMSVKFGTQGRSILLPEDLAVRARPGTLRGGPGTAREAPRGYPLADACTHTRVCVHTHARGRAPVCICTQVHVRVHACACALACARKRAQVGTPGMPPGDVPGPPRRVPGRTRTARSSGSTIERPRTHTDLISRVGWEALPESFRRRLPRGAGAPRRGHQSVHGSGRVPFCVQQKHYSSPRTSIRNETLSGAPKIAIFRVRAGAPGPLQMRRARSAINFGGVNAF
jgi:hypothetical protein